MTLTFDISDGAVHRASCYTGSGHLLARVWDNGAWSVTLWPDDGPDFSLTQSGHATDADAARGEAAEAAEALIEMARTAEGVSVEVLA